MFYLRDRIMKKLLVPAVLAMLLPYAAFASYEDALTLFQEKKYGDSLNRIAGELAVGRDMDAKSPNYELRFLAAHNHWRLGNHEPAISHFKRCIEIQREIVDPYVDLSLLLVELKRYQEAEAVAVRGLALQKNAMLYFLVGKSSFGVGNYWRAKEFFEKAIGMDPALYVAYNSLGCTLMRLERYAHANTAFSAALSIAPSSAEILNNMALSLERLGKMNGALSYLKKASEQSPENPVIRANLKRVSESKR